MELHRVSELRFSLIQARGAPARIDALKKLSSPRVLLDFVAKRAPLGTRTT
jgi:hypothetical protein